MTTPFTDVDPVRRRMMAAIRSRETKPEKVVRSALHAAGHRYRLHVRDLPGQPDIVFRSRRVAIFVHGCFWHLHRGCRHSRIPRTRTEYWSAKLKDNSRRDALNLTKLRRLGWSTFVIWECEAPKSWMRRLFKLLDPPGLRESPPTSAKLTSRRQRPRKLA